MIPSDELAAAPLERLRNVAKLEATTLLALILVAVPLKHVAHVPVAVDLLGPVHGFAFGAYCWTVVQTGTSEHWTRATMLRLVLSALVPFGGFLAAASLPRSAPRAAKR